MKISQLITAQSIALGLRSGLGQACHHRYFDQDYERSFPLRPVLSKVIGLNATFGIGSHLSLEAGLNYEEKGNIRYAVKNQYQYVSLPVTLKWISAATVGYAISMQPMLPA